jgi:hypothetical protein
VAKTGRLMEVFEIHMMWLAYSAEDRLGY